MPARPELADLNDMNEPVARLWRAFRRDLSSAILHDNKALRRLEQTWNQLCTVDLGLAAYIYEGAEVIIMLMARHGQPDSPADYAIECMKAGAGEALGLAQIGREMNPDAEVQTLGDLMDLGKKAISDEIDNLP